MQNWNIVFVDVDGVLNSAKTLHKDDVVEHDPVFRLMTLVCETNAKIVLTSSWRLSPKALSYLMDALLLYNLTISGITPEGVDMNDFKGTIFEDVIPTEKYTRSGTVTYDRGAEIAKWLLQHKYEVRKFVILDDEDEDIKNWFPNDELVKINFERGLTYDDTDAAKKILKSSGRMDLDSDETWRKRR